MVRNAIAPACLDVDSHNSPRLLTVRRMYIQVVGALVKAGVKVLGGPLAIAAGLTAEPVSSFKTEYGENSISIEVVPNLQTAIDHIHRFGSGHTESIVTEDKATAQVCAWLACVYPIYACCARHADSVQHSRHMQLDCK
jgi:gamma-glutamyl phosphate reductase